MVKLHHSKSDDNLVSKSSSENLAALALDASDDATLDYTGPTILKVFDVTDSSSFVADKPDPNLEGLGEAAVLTEPYPPFAIKAVNQKVPPTLLPD